ncbi:MAG TPA: TetR/AcrR family transcriptional regulator C-terminal domain-containing protein [Solirubrobacteraceae bacterium]|jgi:AcrR family transcriptional regulator
MTEPHTGRRGSAPVQSAPGPARRRRGRPAKLSRASIVAAALALLDRDGPDALTMRRLGSELGVEAMSLYRHIADRAALLEALAEHLASEIERHGEEDWGDALRTFAGELRALARRHPAAFALVGTRVLGTPRQLAPIEEVLAGLRRGGFTPARAIFAYRLVASYARGYALSEIQGFAIEPGSDVALPSVRALGRRLASEPTEANFRAGLETIVAGLRAERE